MRFSPLSARVVGKRLLFALAGAMLFGGLFILVEAMREPAFSGEGVRRAFVLLAIYGICMVVLNTVFFALIERWSAPAWRISFSLIAQAFGAFLLAAVLTTWTGGHLIRLMYPEMNFLGLDQYVRIAFYCLAFGIPVFLYMVARGLWQSALEKVKEKELTQERLERELLAARLQALQAQTNPHFLFNALNSIATLIATDPARAEATVERLASLFRYALDRHDGRYVPLSEEIRVVEDYLAIEKTRFGDRLNSLIAVDSAVLALRLPPLLLQPLVENAVKHGVAQREDETAVEVTCESVPDGRIRLSVANDGPAPAPESGWSGVGLENLLSRCRTLFGSGFTFRLWQPRPGWTLAELEIPAAEAVPSRDDGGVENREEAGGHEPIQVPADR
jgi:sensor histidine kinase YesM